MRRQDVDTGLFEFKDRSQTTGREATYRPNVRKTGLDI